MNKKGRKQKHYVDPRTGETIKGLSRMTDGRWRVIGTQIRFSESDETRALERFYELTKQETADQVYDRTTGRHQKAMTINQWWAYAAQQIIDRPQWVAKMTGIEKIAYLKNLEAPETLPSFDEIKTAYTNHAKASDDEKRRVKLALDLFVKATGVKGIENITSKVAVQFKDFIHAKGWSPSSQKNTFARVRSILSFCEKHRAMAVEEITRALACLKVMLPSDSVLNLDPKPVEVGDFTALMKAATGDDEALVLLMLNCGLYLQEAINTRWDDIKQGKYFVAQRRKMGKCLRVAVLWPETLAALEKIKRRGDFVFIAYHGAKLGIKGAQKRWSKLKAAAGVKTNASHLRDGAYTAAVEANINDDICKMMVGHRNGIKDHYVLRRPSMVAPACEAVRQHYLGTKKKPKLKAA